MNEHTPQEKSSRPNIRSFQYDVLLKNLREQDPGLYSQLLLAAEAESSNIHDKEQFVHGFLYNFGIHSEDERTALLERLFELSSLPIGDVGDEDLLRSNEPGDDQPAA